MLASNSLLGLLTPKFVLSLPPNPSCWSGAVLDTGTDLDPPNLCHSGTGPGFFYYTGPSGVLRQLIDQLIHSLLFVHHPGPFRYMEDW